MQDEIIRGILNKGVSTPRPYFILLTGTMGVGKRHTMAWLDRAGRFPMETFIWVDPYQIAMQLPECLEMLKDPSSPQKNHKVMEATRREAGCIAEILVAEALFRKKSVVFSTSIKDVEWWKKWIEGVHSLHSEYRFGTLHIDAPAEDVVQRRKYLQKSFPFQQLPDLQTTMNELKRAALDATSLSELELYEYTAVISNPTQGDLTDQTTKKKNTGSKEIKKDDDRSTIVDGGTPKLVSESGGHAWSTAPAPSEVNANIEFSDLELEAFAWRDNLSQVWVDNALVMPRARVPKRLQAPGFIKLLNQWRLFCQQWVNLFDVAPRHTQQQMGLELFAPPPERTTWNSRPRLYLTAGQTANVRVYSYDMHLNPIVNVEATNIQMEVKEATTAISNNGMYATTADKNSSSSELTCSSRYDGDGSYICTYSSKKMGVYELSIGNKYGESVPGSPFWLHVVSGEMDAKHCRAQGPALQSIFYGSNDAVFNIETFDSFHNPVGVGGHEFDVHILASDTTTLFSSDSVSSSKTSTTVIDAPGSKKAALRDALNHAAQLEGEVALLSSSHEAVLRGDAATGNVADLGNGTYGVRFDPRQVPKWMKQRQKSMIILVVDAVSGEHIAGSPFVVPCVNSAVRSSQCTLEMDHIDNVVAGDVYSATIGLPKRHSALQSLPSIQVRPIWSGESNVLPVQSCCVYYPNSNSVDTTNKEHEDNSNNNIITLFSIKSSSEDPLMYEASYGGGLIRASGGRNVLLPAISASSAVSSECVRKEQNHFGGLRVAAAGKTNIFEIQAKDRFGIKLSNQDCGSCRARIMGPLGQSIICRASDTQGKLIGGVWKFEYDVPLQLGLFGHSGGEPCVLSIAVELWDEERETWSHIGESPFRVPVHVMLAESLKLSEFGSNQPIKSARLQLWTGHRGSGSRVVVGSVGEDGVFGFGDLRHFTPGMYTVEIEARGYFPRRFAAFIPQHGVQRSTTAPKITKKRLTAHQKSSMSGANPTSDIAPPEYVTLSSSEELPRLRVLKQGDIDLSDSDISELKHLWWFAKRDIVIAASMKSSGELVELDLDHCITLFGDDPTATSEHGEFVPTAYNTYLEARSIYNKQVGDLLKAKNEINGTSQDSTGGVIDELVRWSNVQALQMIRNNIDTFVPKVPVQALSSQSSVSISADLVQQMSRRSELLIILTWNNTTSQDSSSAPSLVLDFSTNARSNHSTLQTLSHFYLGSEQGQQLKRDGIFSSWERDESAGVERLCLRDVPGTDFSVQVLPEYATHSEDINRGSSLLVENANTVAVESEPGIRNLEALSSVAATVQIFQRTGHIGTFAAHRALTSFHADNSKVLMHAYWSILRSSTPLKVQGKEAEERLLFVDDRIHATYDNRQQRQSRIIGNNDNEKYTDDAKYGPPANGSSIGEDGTTDGGEDEGGGDGNGDAGDAGDQYDDVEDNYFEDDEDNYEDDEDNYED